MRNRYVIRVGSVRELEWRWSGVGVEMEWGVELNNYWAIIEQLACTIGSVNYVSSVHVAHVVHGVHCTMYNVHKVACTAYVVKCTWCIYSTLYSVHIPTRPNRMKSAHCMHRKH